MERNIQFRDVPTDAPILVKRVNKLMEEQKITQGELAARCGISATTISACFGKDKTGDWRDPRAGDLLKIAKFFGVSLDYLFGEDECKSPDDEQIHIQIGLSDGAIKNLRNMNRLSDKEGDICKKITVINCLLENAEDSTLLISLYDYLLGLYSFPGREQELGAAFMVELLPNGQRTRNLVFKEVFSKARFVAVQEDLILEKNFIQKKRGTEDKSNRQEPEGKESL